jgi:hypothetical protein
MESIKCTIYTISNQKKTGKIDTSNIYINNRSLSWLGTGTSINSGRIKLVLWTQALPLSELVWSFKCFLHVSKIPIVTKNWMSSVVLKNTDSESWKSVPITTNVVSLNPTQTECTHYNIMWLSLSVTCGRSVVFSGYSCFLHQWNTATI